MSIRLSLLLLAVAAGLAQGPQESKKQSPLSSQDAEVVKDRDSKQDKPTSAPAGSEAVAPLAAITIPQPFVMKNENPPQPSLWVIYGPFLAPVLPMIVTLYALSTSRNQLKDQHKNALNLNAVQHQNELNKSSMEHERELERLRLERRATWKREAYVSASDVLSTLYDNLYRLHLNRELFGRETLAVEVRIHNGKLADSDCESVTNKVRILRSILVTSRGLVSDETYTLLSTFNTEYTRLFAESRAGALEEPIVRLHRIIMNTIVSLADAYERDIT